VFWVENEFLEEKISHPDFSVIVVTRI